MITLCAKKAVLKKPKAEPKPDFVKAQINRHTYKTPRQKYEEYSAKGLLRYGIHNCLV
jgi:hypothetical protein